MRITTQRHGPTGRRYIIRIGRWQWMLTIFGKGDN